jgi:hypothetical protein
VGAGPTETDAAPVKTSSGEPPSADRQEAERARQYAGQIYRNYKPLLTIAVGPSGTLMAGGEQGILRRVQTRAAGDLYEEGSATEVNRRTYRDRITLPYDWLFVSGDHEVERVDPA